VDAGGGIVKDWLIFKGADHLYYAARFSPWSTWDVVQITLEEMVYDEENILDYL